MSLDNVLLLAALICCVIATFGKSWGGINYLALGGALFLLTYFL